jgi:hypothetical protein
MDEFIGKIVKIVDPDLYKIEVDIPGYNKNLPAFPKRGEVDEPRIGDVVILKELDPNYKSYYLWEKLKENDFIGIRSRGKVVRLSKDEISIGIFDPSDNSWYDKKDGKDPTPKPTSWYKIDSKGNIDINAEGKQTVNITGDCTIKIGGNAKVEISGNSDVTVKGNTKVETSGKTDINSSGKTTVKSPDVQITGGKLTVNGTAAPTGSGGFCGIPVCPFSGAPHIGPIISGT